MRRLIGSLMIGIGALPLLALLIGVIAWVQHMYTVGIDLDTRIVLAAVATADLVCLGIGLYLVARPGRISS